MRVLVLNEVMALVAARDGYILVNRNDVYVGKAIAIYGEYSGLESAFLASLVSPGDCVIEAGANIGAHTVSLAKAVGAHGKVYAFEPQHACYTLLNAQLALNRLDNVIAYNEGVGQIRSQLWVPRVNYSMTGNFGSVALSQENTSASNMVDVVPLDEKFGDTTCALIKIDVEGMEEAVVRGAAKLIGKHHPTIYVENDRVENSKSLISLIQGLGYRLWWHTPALYNPNNFFQVKDNVYENLVSFNMLCCHKPHPSAAGLVEIKTPDDPHPLEQ